LDFFYQATRYSFGWNISTKYFNFLRTPGKVNRAYVQSLFLGGGGGGIFIEFLLIFKKGEIEIKVF
jgi:hypothetical protein